MARQWARANARAPRVVVSRETETAVNDAARLDRILAALPNPADREWLAERLEPRWRRRERRLEERDEAVRTLAAERFGALPSGRAMATEMRRALSVYAAGSTCKGETVPSDSRRASLHRLLKLFGGRVPSVGTLRAALAGIRSMSGGQNSVTDISHEVREALTIEK